MGACDVDCAQRLLEAAPPTAFTLIAEAATVLAQEGVPPARSAPPLARSLCEMFTGGVVLDRLEPAVLEQLDAVIRIEQAAELTDTLHRDELLPQWNRLPRLLAADPDRLARLIRDCAELMGPRSLSWAQCVSEAMMGCQDAGTAPPPLLTTEFQALIETTTPHSIRTEGYQARLRLAARSDPAGALTLLKEACWEVGCYEVEHGLEAVLGRLARINRPAFDRYLAEQTNSLPEQALAFRAGIEPHDEPAEGERLSVMVEQLEGAIARDELPDRDIWTAAFELLRAAARLGAVAAAQRIIRAAGPPQWTILNATWAPTRRRGLEGDADAMRFLERISAALDGAGSGPASRDQPPAPEWSEFPPPLPAEYWRLRALPLEQLPWWTPWGAGMP
jgi:hypothetical protein